MAFEKQTDIWLPEDRDQACTVIGKLTQGRGERLTRKLVTDQGELEFLIRDTCQKGTLVGAPETCPLGHVITYYDGNQPQYTHLGASMLGYARISLLMMLTRFGPGEVVTQEINIYYCIRHP